jgi:hypothetical protein
MRAISIRQPWAELILRGVKTIECRSRPTRVRGQLWIYATQRLAIRPSLVIVDDLESLPRGLVVGTAELVGCRPLQRSDARAACTTIDFDGYAWLLARPRRLVNPRRPDGHPQPVFFYPFAATSR